MEVSARKNRRVKWTKLGGVNYGSTADMSIQIQDTEAFTHILRVMNTNIDGRHKAQYALTAVRGVGRRISDLALKKAGIDASKRAGQLSQEEVDKFVNVIASPLDYKIPLWFINRQRDYKDGENYHSVSNQIDTRLRDDLERLKKIRNHRGIRHLLNLKVRGQHTKTTGRRGAGRAEKRIPRD